MRRSLRCQLAVALGRSQSRCRPTRLAYSYPADYRAYAQHRGRPFVSAERLEYGLSPLARFAATSCAMRMAKAVRSTAARYAAVCSALEARSKAAGERFAR